MATELSTISASARADAPITSSEIIGIVALYITISTIFTVARLYVRFFIHQQLWWDDWTMFFAWLGTVSLCTLQLIMIQYGAGVNIWEVPEPTLKEYLKLWLDIQMAARVAIFFARLSILLFYIRIFFPIGTQKSIFWWIIQAVIWINTLYSVSLILVLTLQCVPYRNRPWGSSCVNQWLVLINASVINIISDIAVLAIPIASIIRLKTTKRRKWAIWALFAFGTLAPLASLARLGYQIPLADGENRTVIYPIVLFLATAEQTVAMIVGSAPIASGVIISTLRQKRRPAHLQKKTLTERFWPSREARSGYVGASPGVIPDPFPITGPGSVVTESAEGLNPNIKGRRSDGRDEGSWEMVNLAMPSATKAAPREDSGTSCV
ncbi:putative integral membrane protein [Rosellinia necatrix]|uniref:Putative integral membrane protein n=1 Tax=Rosellinia necatrix TaxID=77044 RepID=A0A1W2TTA6_ROSNE|nr:putative integral membrane protein [Rosellinia necatrix]